MVKNRTRRSVLQVGVALAVLAAAAFGAGRAMAEDGAAVIRGCASNSNGSLRLVGSEADCRSNERAVRWSAESPIELPQSCPTGQFVTGITGTGRLACAAPTSTGGGGTGGGGTGGGGGDSTFCSNYPSSLPHATVICDPFMLIWYYTCDMMYDEVNGVVADGCETGPLEQTG